MKNKTKIAFLTTILSLSLALGACGSNGGKSSDNPTDSSSQPTISSVDNSSSQEGGNSSSNSSSSQTSSSQGASSSSSSSSQVASSYTVTFVIDGKVVQTSEVNPGDTASYEGETPTKTSDNPNVVYRFKGWDKDLTQPINADTVFTAVFEESVYSSEIAVDDFESYDSTGDMKDAGWEAMGYNNDTKQWTNQTSAAVSLGYNSVEGNKSLKFDAWENGVGYKFVKTLQPGAFTNSANALRFRLMVPKMNLVKVFLKGQVTIAGTQQAPSFSYQFHPTTDAFVEYTIPLADDGWALWDDSTKTIKSVAEWMGIHEDDYLKYLTSIDFYIQGDDSSVGGKGYSYHAYLDSVKFVTLGTPQNTSVETVNQYDRYTGTLADGTTVRVDLGANGQATAKLIDLEVPQTIPGTYTIVNKQMTFTSSDSGASLVYKGNITDGGTKIEFASATGNFATAVDDMDLNAVQVVQDFESFTENGVAYSQQNYDDTEVSGIRGSFYGEYYTATGSADWGGGGWQLLPDGDEINLINDANVAHTGNKCLSLKHFKNNAVRYLEWDLYKEQGEKRNVRASKMGFWLKGFVDKLTVYAFRRTKPTASEAYNKEGLEYDEFNIDTNVSDWTHVEVELNPLFIYHGFMIKIEKDYNHPDSTLYVDDVEAYYANPYAEYVPPEVKKLTVGTSYNGIINGLARAQMFIRDETRIYVMIPGLTSTTLKGTYTFENQVLVITFTGGDVYTADVSEDLRNIRFKSMTGTGEATQYLNNVDFDLYDYADVDEAYEESGLMYYQYNTNPNKRSGARGGYYCEYAYSGGNTSVGGSGWILMGGSGDQLSLATEGALVGQKSLKMKKSTAGAMRYMQWGLYDGTAEAHTGVSKFTVFLKNPMSTETKLSLMVYKVQKVTTATNTDDNKVVKEITLAANEEWTRYTIDLDVNETYYGYAILADKASASDFFYVDCPYYYNVDNDPALDYYAKKDMVLNGNTNAGAASIKFDELGKFHFTCANLGANNVEGSYDLVHVDSTTNEMTLNISGTVIKGTYAVDADFKATFTVTEATGTMASYISIGTVFSNQ